MWARVCVTRYNGLVMLIIAFSSYFLLFLGPSAMFWPTKLIHVHWLRRRKWLHGTEKRELFYWLSNFKSTGSEKILRLSSKDWTKVLSLEIGDSQTRSTNESLRNSVCPVLWAQPQANRVRSLESEEAFVGSENRGSVSPLVGRVLGRWQGREVTVLYLGKINLRHSKFP